MDHLQQEAVRKAIVTEKNSFHFYRSAAAKVHDGSVRRRFEYLAAEEARHLELFLDQYSGSEFGDLQDIIVNPPHLTSQPQALLSEMTGSTGEKIALELALQEEEFCLDCYSILITAIKSPAVRAVFQVALAETRRHCEILKEEYQHIMTMVGSASQESLCESRQTVEPE